MESGMSTLYSQPTPPTFHPSMFSFQNMLKTNPGGEIPRQAKNFTGEVFFDDVNQDDSRKPKRVNSLPKRLTLSVVAELRIPPAAIYIVTCAESPKLPN